MVKTLPTRAEIPVQYTWDLTPVYATDEAWDHEFATVPPLLEELISYRGRLEDAETLLQALTLRETIGLRLGRLYVYASLRRDEDTTDATHQAQADRAQQLY